MPVGSILASKDMGQSAAQQGTEQRSSKDDVDSLRRISHRGVAPRVREGS